MSVDAVAGSDVACQVADVPCRTTQLALRLANEPAESFSYRVLRTSRRRSIIRLLTSVHTNDSIVIDQGLDIVGMGYGRGVLGSATAVTYPQELWHANATVAESTNATSSLYDMSDNAIQQALMALRSSLSNETSGVAGALRALQPPHRPPPTEELNPFIPSAMYGSAPGQFTDVIEVVEAAVYVGEELSDQRAAVLWRWRSECNASMMDLPLDVLVDEGWRRAWHIPSIVCGDEQAGRGCIQYDAASATEDGESVPNLLMNVAVQGVTASAGSSSRSGVFTERTSLFVKVWRLTESLG